MPQPRLVGDHADRKEGLADVRPILSRQDLPATGALIHEHFVPIRTAKIQATFRDEPLQARHWPVSVAAIAR